MEPIEMTIAMHERMEADLRKYIFSYIKKNAKNFENVVNIDGSKYESEKHENK